MKIENQSEAIIPTKYGNFRSLTYASDADEKMPALVLIHESTTINDKIVNVRIHSECMTGDVFGSYRCECGEQLDYSMKYVAENGGLIIYLRQEGRGIGIINKLHAYNKQDEGYDTAEANKVLGFGYDDRTYDEAIAILHDLGFDSINLLTNNPSKIQALEIDPDITVHNRISIEIPSRLENEKYLETKKDKFGHMLKL